MQQRLDLAIGTSKGKLDSISFAFEQPGMISCNDLLDGFRSV